MLEGKIVHEPYLYENNWFIVGQAFLLFENLDKSTWKKTLRDSRSAYSSLRDHFLRDIEHPDGLSATDPLTDDETVSLTASAL